MADVFSAEKRSWVMRQVRSADTDPELTLRSALHQRGYRFRLHDKRLPGKPDIILPRYHTAIFVNGCFWHGHACPDGTRPKSNTAYWDSKIQKNKARDLKNARRLRRQGWHCFVVWTCQFRDLERLVSRLARRLEAYQHGPANDFHPILSEAIHA